MGAVFKEVITVSGADVGEDGVHRGSFARSHLLDCSEEHDTHSCTKNIVKHINETAVAIKAAMCVRILSDILGYDIFILGCTSILRITFFLSRGGGGTK